MTERDNGWDRYQNMVLDKLERLEERLDCVDKKVGNLRVDVGKLNVKSGIWGMIGGTIPLVVAILLYVLKGTL
jgi:hypothetical protein